MKEELTRAARSLDRKCTGRRAAQVWKTLDNPRNYNRYWFTVNQCSWKQTTRAEHMKRVLTARVKWWQSKPAEPAGWSGPSAVSTQHRFFFIHSKDKMIIIIYNGRFVKLKLY